ncbi:hypothetical protein Ancab_024087 [Ancistrocladus abbreviatus]
MSSHLLDIQPRELKFIFELQKQSNCTVRLVNNTDQHVAFKVKTTSPKKYCVKPNTGVIQPKEACEFVVTMQAQQSAPPDMICKDKFLIQSTTVPAGTMEVDVTSDMFSKEDEKHVDERKLKVILVSPPHSPELSPINGTLRQMSTTESSIVRDKLLSQEERLNSCHMVDEHQEESKTVSNEYLKPVKDREFEPIKDVVMEPMKTEGSVMMKDMAYNLPKDVETVAVLNEKVKGIKEMHSEIVKDAEQLKLVRDVDEMKAKLRELEANLSKAEVTISKLTEQRRLTIQETEILQQELALLRTKNVERRIQVGFPFLFVCMVAFVSVVLGYSLNG